MVSESRIRVTMIMLIASYLGNAILFGLWIKEWMIQYPDMGDFVLWAFVTCSLLIYLCFSWALPFFVSMMFTISDCPQPFFSRGQYVGSGWRSSRFASHKSKYKEAGPFDYYGFAYLYARFWALVLDWATVHEDFAVYYCVQSIKTD